MSIQAYTTAGYGEASVPNPTVISNRSPTTSDIVSPAGNPYTPGQYWQNQLTAALYVYLGGGFWDEIAGGSGGPVDTLTGNSGGAVIPTAGNINVLGSNTTTVSGSGSTLTISPTLGGYPTTPFVVGPSGKAGYQTIASAITAASSAGGGVIVVQPGNYTENLTLVSNVEIMGLNFADAGGGVNITGVHTPPASGGFVFRNVSLISSTNIFNSTAAGTAHLVIADTIINVTNGYTFNLPNWTGKLESFDVNAAVGTADGYINNTAGAPIAIFECSVGSGTSNPMILSGSISAAGANIYCPISFVTGSVAGFDYSYFGATLTFSNNSVGTIANSHFVSGATPAITMSSSGAWNILASAITSSNNPSISGSGAGILTLGGVDFTSNTSTAGTLTLGTADVLKAGALQSLSTVTAATSMTATSGAITATSGNFVASAAGTGLVFPVATGSGAASGTVTCNGRQGSVTFTSPSIAAGAVQTLTMANSAITGSATVIMYTLRGATTGAALTIQSVTNSASQSAIVVTNGTGATTTTANITFDFIVLN